LFLARTDNLSSTINPSFRLSNPSYYQLIFRRPLYKLYQTNGALQGAVILLGALQGAQVILIIRRCGYAGNQKSTGCTDPVLPPSLPCPGTILGLRRLANDNPSVGLSESSGAGQTCLWAGWVGHESSATPGGAGDSCRSLRSGVELMGRMSQKPSKEVSPSEMLSRSLEVRRDPISGALSRRGLR